MQIPFPIALPDFLNETDHEIRVTGHRISLYDVLSDYNFGLGVEELWLRFTTLKLATIHKLIAFYLDHQPEVDAFLTTYAAALQKHRDEGAHMMSLAELQQRMEQIRRKALNAAQVSH